MWDVLSGVSDDPNVTGDTDPAAVSIAPSLSATGQNALYIVIVGMIITGGVIALRQTSRSRN